MKIRNFKLLITVSVILTAFYLAGCSITKNSEQNNSINDSISQEASPSPTPVKELTSLGRDDQRVKDIETIARALDAYAAKNPKAEGPYPKSNGLEKIDGPYSSTASVLRESGYWKEQVKDPLSPKSFYGYKSDGYSYELTAVLENKNDKRCTVEGSLCIHRVKNDSKEIKEIMDLTDTSSWKVYRNDEYGFEVKYSNELEETTEMPAIIGFYDKFQNKNNDLFQIRVNNRKNNMGFKDQIRGMFGTEPEMQRINGQDFYYIQSKLAGTLSYEYYLEHNNKIFMIALFVVVDVPNGVDKEEDIKYPTDESMVAQVKILQAMASTFKFFK